MPTSRPHWSRTAVLLVGAIATAASLTACDDDGVATVTHIVDGDTIDVSRDGEERRVRLLNIDTPESTDPDTEPDCLGPEATEFLRELVPVGTEVRLETDEELEDQYGRLLAGVYLEDALVNAEIARAGLGVAVLYEPNDRFYDEVLGAQEDARAAGRGLYDPEVDCTVPAQADALAETAENVVAAAPAGGASLDSLEGYAEDVAAAVAAAVALEELLDGDARRFPLAALSAADLDVLRRSVTSTTTELDLATRAARQAIEAEEARLAEEAARRAAEEEARRAAEEEARRAAEEEARQAAEQRARERQQETQRSEQPRRSSSNGSSGSSGSSRSSGSSGGYDGYTGCRAYGGHVPNAVDEQGRPYTKIDCSTKMPIG